MKRRIFFKSVASIVLVSAIVFLSALALVMAPLYLALSMKGHAKTSTLLQIIPLGILISLVVKIWKEDGLSDTERAYYDGIVEGQIKASKKRGIEAGARMIAVPEDLSIKPVYSMRKQSPYRSQQNLQGDLPDGY